MIVNNIRYVYYFPVVTLRRIADDEKPLVLRLIWGGADRSHSFCLQENETGDIMVSYQVATRFFKSKIKVL